MAVLDREQKSVVEADVEARLLVTAGPGAGKSRVVGERCCHLVEEGLDPDQVLAISFSNAAVDVMRERTRDARYRGRSIDVLTLDSLAARVRLDLEPAEPHFSGYEHAIARALKLLAGAESTPFDHVEHVIVDEAQDLLGPRAELALSVIKRVVDNGGGFTVLGDPMQGLYDFQRSARNRRDGVPLIDAVRSQLATSDIVLKGEYRARSADAARVSRMRAAVAPLGAPERLATLRGLLADLVPLGALDADAARDVTGWHGATAFLCDTNARAGLVADALSVLGVRAELASERTDSAPAQWVAQIIAAQPGPSLSREEFDRAASVLGLTDVDGRWRAIVRAAGSQRGVQIADLVRSLGTRRCPPSLRREPATPIIVSTVHRAKGLEFDNVILVDPHKWFMEDGEEDAASKRLFVALTRAHNVVTTVRGPDPRAWYRDDVMSVSLQRAPKNGTRGILLEPRLCRALGPADVELESVVGRSVEWARADDLMSVNGTPLPSWMATVDGVPVARTGESFGEIMNRRARTRLPELQGGRVEGLETVIGAPSAKRGGRHGMWVGARIAGAMRFDWRAGE